MKANKKKQYVVPQMAVYNIESMHLLAGSDKGETQQLLYESYEW